MSTEPRTMTRSSLPCSADQVDDFLGQPRPDVVDLIARTPGPFMVLGAGGKMGLHLALMLRYSLKALGRADEVFAVSRFKDPATRAAFARRGVKPLDCDLMDRAALAALPDAPTVFYLAGVKFGTAGNAKLLEDANVLMPRQVAERFYRSQIVAFSTGCVYPFVSPTSGGATERTPIDPVGDYAKSCAGREHAFEYVANRFGTHVALIRLNYAVEFRYGTLVDIALSVLHGEPIDVSMGYVNVIWQSDAIAYSILALALADSPAVPLNVTGPETLAVRDLAQRFGKRFGREPVLVGTESETAWLNDARMMFSRFGPPGTKLDVMIEWVAEWLQRGLPTLGKPTGFARRDGQF
jgi:nucleoside-diphosphate-sugar epimerase